MSLNTPTPAAHSPTHAAVSSVARTRAPQGAAGHGASAGPSAFAQLLKGVASDDSASDPTPTPTKASQNTDENTNASTNASANASATGCGNEQPATAEQKPDPADKAARDAAADAQPQAPQPDAPAPTNDLAASMRQAGLLAAMRAKAGADGAGRHGLAALKGKGLAGAEDPTAGLAGTPANAASLAADAKPGDKPGLDISDFKATLDATPVNLAPVEPGAEAAAGAGDFSLPSLGAADTAPAAPSAPPQPPAQATLQQPPGSAAFPAALGAQLNTWLKDGVQYATLELNPQDMGPIDVRIALQGGRTQVELGADVAATRQALAEALPALAEALGDVGLSLSGGSVSDQTGQHARSGDEQAQRAFSLPGWLAPAREGESQATAAAPQRAQRGLIDLVA